jgi:hypothetical protein
VVVTDGQTLTNLDENGIVVGTPSPLPTSADSGLPATFGGTDLWTVVQGGGLEVLHGDAYPNKPAVYPDLNGNKQPAWWELVTVGLVYDAIPWQEAPPYGLGVTAQEQDQVLEVALGTLRDAYKAFLVTFTASATEKRLIYIKNGIGGGAAGITHEVDYFSNVYFWTVANTLLDTVGCGDKVLVACTTRSRPDLLNALGRGLGATMAHELGHQNSLWWTTHRAPESCYDHLTSVTLRHFFGLPLEWSDEAIARMRDILLPAPPPPVKWNSGPFR